MMGSLVYVGAMTVEEALAVEDIEGTSVGEALDHIGHRGTAPAPGPVPHAFVELHIEQGPVLERTGFTIGAVTGVQGISWSELTITGQSNHAGTTPLSMRRDPGLVAAKVAVFVRQLADELGAPLVGTVGQIVLHPNLVNVVPATATMTIDLRHTDEDTLQIAEKRVARFVAEAAADEGVDVAWRSLARFEPVRFADDMVALVEETASQLEHSHTTLPSGAGHDAQMLARVAPTAMIFTPSHNGLSHNPAEHTDPADIEAGANVLLHVLYKLAEDPT
jgi:N-carbamoyl-L-amino-acid hydrolase